MRVTRRQVAIVVAVLVAAALIAAVAFGPVVRKRVAKEAAARGLEVSVGGVRPAWMAVRLLDVHVNPVGVSRVEANLGEVRVELTGSLGVERVRLRSGKLSLRGDLEKIQRDLVTWKARGAAAPESRVDSARASLPIEGDDLSITWSGSTATDFDATGVSFARGDHATWASAELAHLHDRDLVLNVGGTTVDLDGGYALRAAHATSVEIIWNAPATSDGSAGMAPGSGPSLGEPSASAAPPPPVILAKATRATKTTTPSTPSTPEATGPFLVLPDLRAWRAVASTAAGKIAAPIPDAVTISVDALSAKLVRGASAIAFGPGPFSAARRGGRVDLLFSSSGSGGTPLSLHATLPVAEGDVALTLEGGPVALSALGLKDGTAGLTDVDRATLAGKGRVVLSDDAITFDGELRLRGAALRQPRLASDVIRGLELAVLARGVLDAKGELRLDDFGATVGAVHVSASGVLRQSDDHVTATMRFDVPSAGCQALLESVPSALLPTLRGAKYSGTFGARGTFNFDSRALDDLVLSYDIQDQCRVSEAPPALARERFKQAFTHRTYLPDGSLSEETTGPGTGKWVSFGAISPFMIVAVMTTEDGGFYRHHGFSHPAIRSSIIANLKARRFVRGASTISMQLAKNLFLLREKTLSRKLEEVILTDYLEQVFTKDELMELYLNVIEYAPNVYGIGPAAYHYFGRSASELNLAECLFLSSMLPAPLRYSHLRSGGQLSESWQNTLVHLMSIAKRSGLISEEELEEGKGETVMFSKTGPRGPARRHSHLDAPPGDEGAQLEESN